MAWIRLSSMSEPYPPSHVGEELDSWMYQTVGHAPPRTGTFCVLHAGAWRDKHVARANTARAPAVKSFPSFQVDSTRIACHFERWVLCAQRLIIYRKHLEGWERPLGTASDGSSNVPRDLGRDDCLLSLRAGLVVMNIKRLQNRQCTAA